MDNMKKSIEEQIALSQKLGDALVAANKKGFESKDAIPASQLVGLSSIQKQIVDIQEQAHKSAMAAKEAYAAAFAAREDGMTPDDAARLAEGIDKIDAAWKRVVETQTEVLKSNHAITTSFDTGVKDAWASFVENSKDSAAQAKSSFSNFTTGLEDAFVKLATTGKLSFSELANSIIADLARIAVRKAIVGIGSFFGLPGLAAGGPVTPNQPYIVGEKGPELFLPSSAGNIVPNNALSTGGKSGVGGQTVVNYNIQAVDAQSFRSMVARDPSFIYAVTEQGRRSQPTRRAM
jgi:phage-related minor tail protein